MPRFLLLAAALLCAAPARAAYPFVSSTSVVGSFGGSQLYSIAQNPVSGDIYAAGGISRGAGSSNNDLFIGRYSSSLVLLSSFTYDKAGYYEEAYEVAVDTGTGNVYAVGFVTSTSAYAGRDAWIGKFDSSLNVLSTITYNGGAADGDEAYGLHVASNGVYVIGSSSESGGRGFWLALFDSSLVLVSSSHFMQYGAYGWDVLPTAGGIFVAGSRAPNASTSNDVWVGKYDSSLVIQASATFDGSSSNSDEVRRVVEDGSGGVYVSGYVNNIGAAADHWIARYDSSLVRLSTAYVNGPANGNEHIFGLQRLASGNLLLAGSYVEVSGLGGSNLYLAEYDANLVKLSSTQFTTSGNASDQGLSVLVGANNDIYAAGWATNSGSQDGILARFSTSPFAGISPATGFAGTAMSTGTILWTWTDQSTLETGYRVMSATSGSVSGDLAAGTTSWLEPGITTDTQRGPYWVQAFNSTTTADSGTASRYTLAAAPVSITVGVVTSSSSYITWFQNNRPYTIYTLERSTDAVALFGAIFASSGATAYSDSGLNPSTTYWYRLKATNGDGIDTAYTSTFSIQTTTVALLVGGFAGTAQSTGSILWSWTESSANEDGFRVMSGTTNLSGDLAVNATSWWQFGLATNTAYGPYFVQAFNSSGTVDSASVTRYTHAAAPFGMSTSSVHQTSGTVSWQSSNPGNTAFDLQRSTEAGTGYASIVSTTATSYTDTGLTAAATYWYRVRASNGDAVATAFASTASLTTLPTVVPAAPSGFAGVAQSQTSILWSWTDNSSNETGFRVVSGSVSLSGNLAAGATTWLQTGLSTGTSYGPYNAVAFNLGGPSTSAAASRWTLTNAPVSLAASSVEQTSATISWAANQNGSGVTYELERSTGTGYALYFSTVGFLTYAEAALIPGATHFYRVRAVNGDALASAYSSSISVVAISAPPLPSQPGTPAGTALGTSSASWTWTPLATNATAHWLYRPSDNSILGSTAAPAWVQTSLTPNTAYGLKVGGKNLAGVGPLSPSATVYTLAALPLSPAVSSITYSSMTLTWGLNGNPGSTTAELERSTTGVVYSTRASGAFTSYADVDLLGCTTYFYRVRNRNGDAIATAYVSFQAVTDNTVPAPPAGLTAQPLTGGRIQLDWSPSITEGITGYRLFWDAGTSTISYAAPLSVFTSTETSWVTGVLASSSAYQFALRSVHRCGVVETVGALSGSGASAVPAAIRAVIKEPDSGKRIKGNRVTVLGELVSGIPTDTRMLQFEYKPASATAWGVISAANVNHPNPDYQFPYFVHWDVSGLAAGFYDLRAVAYNLSAVPDPSPASVRVEVVTVNPDIDENDDGGGRVKKDQVISSGVTATVESAGGGAGEAAAVKVQIPAGAVNTATATVSVTANPLIPTAAPAGMTIVGSAIKIDLSNGQTALNTPAQITLTYPVNHLFPSVLQIWYYDDVALTWSRDFTSTVNTSCRTVSGLTPHFSTFALLQGVNFANNLDSVRVYPVPFKPNGNNPDEGKPYTSGDAASGIIFDNLTQGTEIRIYTMSGRLVTGMDNPTPVGAVRWDARNQDGRDVASGAYFAVIKAPGHKPVVRKIVIIR